MSRRIYIVGLRRSGIHLVANWVASQFTDSYVQNNANLLMLHNSPPTALLEAQAQVIVLEDHPATETLARIRDDNKLKETLGDDHQEHRVLLLRDPYNMAASRIKHYDLLSAKGRWIDKRGALGMWVQYAEEFQKDRPVVGILYNRFVIDKEYREELSARIGGTFSDTAMDKVDPNGLGSSFDGLKFQGRGSEMKTDERWREYQHIQAFKDMFTPEVENLVTDIFGELINREDIKEVA